ncbi:hypothetical protein CK203_115998 [Vitis vinifera]|uniref:Uncharacterized protein n=1 Tax=Vitis vinifera TaxID=29760 RepID=A0A438DW50_VITVI|nr:hypothetical protein CK203_115998 [Vitis vinifera]
MNNPTLVVAFVEYSSVVEVENHHYLEKVDKTHLVHKRPLVGGLTIYDWTCTNCSSTIDFPPDLWPTSVVVAVLLPVATLVWSSLHGFMFPFNSQRNHHLCEVAKSLVNPFESLLDFFEPLGKYGEDRGGWCSRDVREAHGMGLWKGIRMDWELVDDRMVLIVGNGQREAWVADIWDPLAEGVGTPVFQEPSMIGSWRDSSKLTWFFCGQKVQEGVESCSSSHFLDGLEGEK